jgi:long-chain fatty acid transport protein
MIRTFTMQAAPALAGALAALVAAGVAHAGGFSTARFGGEHGHPMAQNPTAIYYNPGGIGASKGIQIMLDGSVALRAASFDRVPPEPGARTEVPEPGDAVGANNGKGTVFNVVAAPMIGATARLEIAKEVGLAFGAGFFVPFGGSASWDKNEDFSNTARYPGPADGAQRWWVIDGTIRTLYISAAVAVSISDLVHIGVSGGPAISQIDSMRARTATHVNSLTLEGRSWFKGSSINPHLGGGVLVTPLEDKRKLRIGASYQSPVNFGKYHIEGELRTFFPPNDSVLDVDVHQTLPDIWRLGASYRPIERLELRLFGDFQRWSLFDDQCFSIRDAEDCGINEDGSVSAEGQGKVIENLPRRWEDTFGVRAGASFWIREPLELFSGVGYDSNAVPDAVLDPGLMDFHDISVSLGVRWQFVDWMGAALSYTHLFYIPRDNESRLGHDFLGPSDGPAASGHYTQSIGVINLNLVAGFDPFTKASTKDEEPPPPPGAEMARR